MKTRIFALLYIRMGNSPCSCFLQVIPTGEFDQRIENGHWVAGESARGRTHVPQGLTDERRQGPIAFAGRPEDVYQLGNAVVVFEGFPAVRVGRHVDEYAATDGQQILVAAVQTIDYGR